MCVWSYHFWGNPGSQIMDGFSKDAQGGETEHNPEDYTCSAERQTDKKQLAFSDCDLFAKSAMKKLHKVESKQ